MQYTNYSFVSRCPKLSHFWDNAGQFGTKYYTLNTLLRRAVPNCPQFGTFWVNLGQLHAICPILSQNVQKSPQMSRLVSISPIYEIIWGKILYTNDSFALLCSKLSHFWDKVGQHGTKWDNLGQIDISSAILSHFVPLCPKKTNGLGQSEAK